MGLTPSKLPIKYEDIGLEVSNLFEKNHNYGVVKCNVKCEKGIGGSGLKFESETNTSSGKANGSIELKNEYESDLVIQNKWTSENLFTSEISILNRLEKGTAFSIIPTFDPKVGKFGGSIAAQFNNDFITTRVEAGLEDTKPIITPSIILSSSGWILGAKGAVDPHTNKIDKSRASLGFQGNNFSAFCILNEKGEIFTSLYQRLVETNAEVGISVQLPYGGNDKTKVEFATAYNFDNFHRIQTKFNTQCQIGLAISKNIGNGITISVSGQMDGKNMKSGAHKVGLGLELAI